MTTNSTTDLYSDEAREARFKRVAERRVNRILKDLRLLGNTGNKSLYKYSRADVEKIFDEIEGALKEIKVKFKSRKDYKDFQL